MKEILNNISASRIVYVSIILSVIILTFIGTMPINDFKEIAFMVLASYGIVKGNSINVTK